MAGAATRSKFNMRKYFREVRSEMRKVSWLNKKELKTYTWVVIVIVLAFSLFLGGADWVFAKILGALGILGV